MLQRDNSSAICSILAVINLLCITTGLTFCLLLGDSVSNLTLQVSFKAILFGFICVGIVIISAIFCLRTNPTCILVQPHSPAKSELHIKERKRLLRCSQTMRWCLPLLLLALGLSIMNTLYIISDVACIKALTQDEFQLLERKYLEIIVNASIIVFMLLQIVFLYQFSTKTFQNNTLTRFVLSLLVGSNLSIYLNHMVSTLERNQVYNVTISPIMNWEFVVADAQKRWNESLVELKSNDPVTRCLAQSFIADAIIDVLRPYLYPFFTEYTMLAGTVLFHMWLSVATKYKSVVGHGHKPAATTPKKKHDTNCRRNQMRMEKFVQWRENSQYQFQDLTKNSCRREMFKRHIVTSPEQALQQNGSIPRNRSVSLPMGSAAEDDASDQEVLIVPKASQMTQTSMSLYSMQFHYGGTHMNDFSGCSCHEPRAIVRNRISVMIHRTKHELRSRIAKNTFLQNMLTLFGVFVAFCFLTSQIFTAKLKARPNIRFEHLLPHYSVGALFHITQIIVIFIAMKLLWRERHAIRFLAQDYMLFLAVAGCIMNTSLDMISFLLALFTQSPTLWRQYPLKIIFVNVTNLLSNDVSVFLQTRLLIFAPRACGDKARSTTHWIRQCLIFLCCCNLAKWVSLSFIHISEQHVSVSDAQHPLELNDTWGQAQMLIRPLNLFYYIYSVIIIATSL